jgi:predicted nucleic-acid-binding protein
MTGLDTNVLIRYLTQDDAAQARIATTTIEGASSRNERLRLAAVTLCELVWVLESSYEMPRADVADALDQMLRAAEIEIEHRDHVRRAAVVYRETSVDFADALVGSVNQGAGCDLTLTFDKGLRRLSSFKVL